MGGVTTCLYFPGQLNYDLRKLIVSFIHGFIDRLIVALVVDCVCVHTRWEWTLGQTDMFVCTSVHA
eukprot:8365305-Lingulodinium_polyedra.AAC.1